METIPQTKVCRKCGVAQALDAFKPDPRGHRSRTCRSCANARRRTQRGYVRPTPTARLWSRVNKDGPVHPVLGTPCWVWTAARDSKGYGVLGCGGRTWRAHRLAWTLTRGAIPEGRWVLHQCDNPPCCNPDYLFLGDNAANTADKMAKGRWYSGARPRGAAHGSARLTEPAVRDIRARYATGRVTQGELAACYGVSRSLVGYIIQRKLWPHLA